MHLASRAVAGAVREPAGGLPRRAQPRLRRVADAAGRPAARRRARAVRAFLRRAFPGRLRAEPRDRRQPHHPPRIGRPDCAASAAIRTAGWKPSETLDPEQIAFLITRPAGRRRRPCPHWLRFLRSLFSGLYTVDNMDFVLRDAYMSGYSTRAFDLDRLLHYSVFTPEGLTIHERGLSALVRFIAVRAELFRAIYFHRTVRAIDLSLQELFVDSKRHCFPAIRWSTSTSTSGSPSGRCCGRSAAGIDSNDPSCGRWAGAGSSSCAGSCAGRWPCERTIFFAPGEAEQSSVFSNERFFEAARARAAAGGAARLADAGRHGPARPSPRRPCPGGRPEFPLRSDHGQDSQPGRPGAVSPHSHQLPHLPDLCRGPPAQRRVGGRHGPDSTGAGSRRRRRPICERPCLPTRTRCHAPVRQSPDRPLRLGGNERAVEPAAEVQHLAAAVGGPGRGRGRAGAADHAAADRPAAGARRRHRLRGGGTATNSGCGTT